MHKHLQAAKRRHLDILAAGAIIGLAAVLAGCANPTASSRVYTFDQAQRAQTVTLGYVIGVRPVTIQASQTSGMGVIAGGALGAVTGSAIGGGSGRRITTVGGAVGGAMAGNAIENASTRRQGLEITIRLDSGDVRVITQEADVPISTGQRVQVVTQGGVSRVVGI
ncbi:MULTISPECIES: glycine zipper 2TM domain-containing protein [unclassified Achromobacter]|uniref:glycine zipper 2TM domain-containing protein n=1 Tax=unclassified Achromobacter TaxID=2626865 RepID=UPI0008D4B919|nr:MULTISPECIES: glycine zipper 2TM domain-containing protein [unclassified Achromobacter]SEI47681.1 outer membrane lipoprotein SlyB [Achromobacter sp. NFACC18-2]SIT30770.1 outer membrane lipoprotein SlyB [Achromobacter sp. MFA1 R4]